jgi:hypothetical protein
MTPCYRRQGRNPSGCPGVPASERRSGQHNDPQTLRAIFPSGTISLPPLCGPQHRVIGGVPVHVAAIVQGPTRVVLPAMKRCRHAAAGSAGLR